MQVRAMADPFGPAIENPELSAAVYALRFSMKDRCPSRALFASASHSSWHCRLCRRSAWPLIISPGCQQELDGLALPGYRAIEIQCDKTLDQASAFTPSHLPRH
jgi:hypothetical protein